MITKYAQIDAQGNLTNKCDVDLTSGQVNASMDVLGVKFEEISENFYQSKEEFETEDMKYRFVIEVFEDPDEDNKYYTGLMVIKSPESLSKENLEKVAETSGIKPEEVNYQDISMYGFQATVASKMGTEEELQGMIKELSKEAVAIESLLGFFLDKPQNLIGNTGWDFLDGRIG